MLAVQIALGIVLAVIIFGVLSIVFQIAMTVFENQSRFPTPRETEEEQAERLRGHTKMVVGVLLLLIFVIGAMIFDSSQRSQMPWDEWLVGLSVLAVLIFFFVLALRQVIRDVKQARQEYETRRRDGGLM